MTIPNLQLLEEMLRVQQTHGAAELFATVSTLHRLRAALALRRRQDVSWYGVQLKVEHLPESRQFTATTGGRVTMKLVLEKKADGRAVSGPQAAGLRATGKDVDGQTRVMQPEDRVLDLDMARYAKWHADNPDATYEEKEAAGFKKDADADRAFEEFEKKRKASQSPKEDFYADFAKDVLRDDFDPTKPRDEQEWKKEDK